jgi:hypothetical protein
MEKKSPDLNIGEDTLWNHKKLNFGKVVPIDYMIEFDLNCNPISLGKSKEWLLKKM